MVYPIYKRGFKMKYYIKNHLGKYKKITKKCYEEIFKINSGILMVSIRGLK